MTWTASETVSEHTQASERTPRRWTKDNKLGEASKTLLKPAPGLKQRNGCGIVCFCCCKCCIGVVPTVRVCIEHIQNCDLRSGMRKRAGVGVSQKEPDLSSLPLHSTHTTYNLARGEFFFFFWGGEGGGGRCIPVDEPQPQIPTIVLTPPLHSTQAFGTVQDCFVVTWHLRPFSSK